MSYSRREALAITVQKKIECNKKALRIVEKMVEETVETDWLLENAMYITDCHFQDVVEERAISKQCGYPVCSKNLGEVPKQQYRISTKTNKVYDITERKHFCSNVCYKASQFFKGQLLTSPVWLRDNETIPKFHLLSPTSPEGRMGMEVEFDPVRMQLESAELTPEGKISPMPQPGDLSSAIACTNEEDVKYQIKTEGDSGEVVPSPKNICDSLHSNDNSVDEAKNTVGNNNSITCDNSNIKISKPKSKVHKKKGPVIDNINLVGRIEKCFSEWFSLDSFIYIHGVEKAKELLKDKVEYLNLNRQLQSLGMDPEVERRYRKLCNKISLLEMNADMETGDVGGEGTKPMPSFEQIQEDAKMMELKVKEFYRGNTSYSLSAEKEAEDMNDTPAIPLVDTHAQKALRRRIFLDRLHHILPDLLRTLGLPSRDVSEDAKNLVKTFVLKADNIMFKPAEWNLIGLIIIKMLSVKDVKLRTMLETKLAQKYASMMLLAFQLDYGYLDRLMFFLCEIDNLVNKAQ